MEEVNKLFSTEGITESNRILHTPSTLARNNLLYVQEVGRLRSLKPHVCKREKLDSYLFFIVLAGEGTVVADDKEHALKEGDCIFLDCRQKYEHISSADNPWELMWVHFNGNNAHVFYEIFMNKNDNGIVFRPNDSSKIRECIQGIILLRDQKDLIAELNAASLLMQLLTECATVVSNEIRLEEVREFINENYREENLIELLCTKFNKQEAKLNKMFYESYGIELNDYVLVKRFTVAKELLRFTIKDIDVIIKESGVQNEDLFRQLFKQNEGITAEEYRMKWAQWIKL